MPEGECAARVAASLVSLGMEAIMFGGNRLSLLALSLASFACSVELLGYSWNLLFAPDRTPLSFRAWLRRPLREWATQTTTPDEAPDYSTRAKSQSTIIWCTTFSTGFVMLSLGAELVVFGLARVTVGAAGPASFHSLGGVAFRILAPAAITLRSYRTAGRLFRRPDVESLPLTDRWGLHFAPSSIFRRLWASMHESDITPGRLLALSLNCYQLGAMAALFGVLGILAVLDLVQIQALR